MSAPASVQTAPAKPLAPMVSSAGSLLQRKCACGGSPGLDGKCPSCHTKRLTNRSSLIQTKLKVGQPDDRYEREADDVATAVMRMPRLTMRCDAEKEDKPKPTTTLPLIQRQVAIAGEEDEEDALIQRKPQADSRPASASQQAGQVGEDHQESIRASEESLNAEELTRGGSVLPTELRSYFESSLGYDLSKVRIHHGDGAVRANERLGARAFTVGSHVWLGQGQPLGVSHTLAHEFVHVIQQTQPSMLPGGAHTRGGPVLRADRSIQREEVFWGAGKDFEPADEVQDAIVAKKKDIKKEVWMPGANRRGVRLPDKGDEPDKEKGRADLFKSDNGKRVGLYFRTVSKCFPEGEPENLPRGQAPLVEKSDGRVELQYLSDAPETIRLGEVKPLAFIERSSGAAQVDGYKEGIEKTAGLLNSLRDRVKTQPPLAAKTTSDCPVPLIKGKDKKWSPIVEFLDATDYGEKAETLIPVASGRKRKLALYTFDETGTPPKRTVILPPKDLQRHVYGDLYYIIHQGVNYGVVTYAWILSNPIDLTDEINRLTRVQQGYEARARAAHNRLVVPLLQPVISQAPAGTVQQLRKPTPIQREPARQILRRQPKPTSAAKEPPALDANFNLKAWLADHQKLGNELKSPKVTENNDAVKFLGGAVKAQKQLERLVPNAAVSGKIKGAAGLEKQYPIPNLLTGSAVPGRTAEKREMTLPEMAALVELWTSRKVVPLAYLRKVFGGFIAGVLNWLGGIPERFRKWREDHDKNDDVITQDEAEKAGKHGKLFTAILRIAWKALKIAVGKAFGQAVQLLLRSTKSGVFKHFKNLFIFDVLKADDPGGPLAYALGLQQKIESKYQDLQGLLKEALAPFAEFVDKFRHFIDFLNNFRQVKDILSQIKNTLRLIKYSACAAGGWVGIAKCLIKSPAEDLMVMFLNICSVRKEIASILFGLGWVSSLPREIARTMRSAILFLLPGDMNDLIDEIPFIRPESVELSCDPPPAGAAPSTSGGQPGKGVPGGGGAGAGGTAGSVPGDGEGEGVFAIDAKNVAGAEKPSNVLRGYSVHALEPDCSHVELYKSGAGNKAELTRTIDVLVQDRKTKSPVVVIRNVKVRILNVIHRGSGIGRVEYTPLNAERLCPTEPAEVRRGCLAALPNELHDARLRTDPKKGTIYGELPYCSALEELRE